MTIEPMQFPEVRVVEASAGSGKTYALAKRYVQLLLGSGPVSPDALRAILAITFTNKATIEMKGRILEFLKRIALDRSAAAGENQDILAGIGISRETARQQAFDAVETIIRQYHFFQVQTIDSFVHGIVAGCAFNLELSARFSVKTDFTRPLAYSLDWCIERAAQDPALAAAFRDFLRRYIHIDNSQSWFPRENIMAVLSALYDAANTHGGTLYRPARCTADELVRRKKDILAHMRTLQENLPPGTNAVFAKSLNTFLAANTDGFLLDDVSAFFARAVFPANKGKAVPAVVDALWDTIRCALASYARDDAYAFFSSYVPLFQVVMEQFRRLAWKEDAVFLQEINRRAHELLAGETTGVPELYYRLAVRFRHLLIDEFQDTSVLQWHNLLAMVEEVLSSGGSLFYVGDKKQAIYRFRGGDASLFDAVPAQFSRYAAHREVLRCNYRSHQAVVTFNNDVFSAENIRRFIQDLQAERKEDLFSAADINEVLHVYADAAQGWLPGNNAGRVVVRHAPGETAEECAAAMRTAIPALVKECSERFAYKEIAVLSRDNREIERVTGWLLAAGIPCESEKTLNVRENAVVKEIFSFLKFLQSPIDNLAFASFITGEALAKAAGLRQGEMAEFLFRASEARRQRGGGYLYREFRESYPVLWDSFIEEFFVNIGFMPVYELTVSILEKLRVTEHFPEHQIFLMRFLELITAREKEQAGAGAFIDYFLAAADDDLFVTATDTNAVRLLTIHKAKGLEFSCVIIPSLEMDAAAGKSGAAAFDTVTDGDTLALVRLSKAHARFSEEIGALRARRYRQAFVDELNTVYVALTRAKCELYVYVPRKASGSLNPVRYLLPVEQEHGSPGAYAEKRPVNQRALMQVPVAVYRDWVAQVKYEFRSDSAGENSAARARGEAVHYFLAQVGCLSSGTEDAVLAAASAKTRAFYPHRTDLGEIEATARRLIAAPALRPVFYAGSARVLTEQDIVDAQGGVHRIDRLLLASAGACIIDYKSARTEALAHQSQVRGYMRLVQEIYPDKKISGMIVYVDDCGVEEVAV